MGRVWIKIHSVCSEGERIMRVGIMQPRTAGLIVAVAAVAWLIAALVGGHASAGSPLPTPQPQVSDYAQISSSVTPPTQAQCFSAGRRCHTPQSVRAAYNIGPLYAQGFNGRGRT